MGVLYQKAKMLGNQENKYWVKGNENVRVLGVKKLAKIFSWLNKMRLTPEKISAHSLRPIISMVKFKFLDRVTL